MSDNKQESSGFSMTPGRLLAAARSARPFSQEDIAKQMRLSVQAIQDIEDDNYERFAAPTFVRGHLRTYAKLVGVSESHVLEALDASKLMPSEPAFKPPIVEGAPVMNVTRQFSTVRNSRLMAVGISAVVVIGLVIAWQGQKSDVAIDQHAQNKIATEVAQLNASQSVVSLPQQTVAPAPTTTAPVTVAAKPATKTVAKVEKNKVAKTDSKTKLVWTKRKNIVISSHALKPTYTLSPVKNT